MSLDGEPITSIGRLPGVKAVTEQGVKNWLRPIEVIDLEIIKERIVDKFIVAHLKCQ